MGFLPYNPAQYGATPDVIIDNNLHCRPGDVATGEVRRVALPTGYTYASMQSPTNPNTLYMRVVRPATNYDFTRPPTDADLVHLTFDMVCQAPLRPRPAAPAGV